MPPWPLQRGLVERSSALTPCKCTLGSMSGQTRYIAQHLSFGREIMNSVICLPTAQRSTAVAQILLAERRGIPHHLLDILSPKEEFSAGDFYTLARTATADILQVRSPCLIALLCASFCLLFTSSNTTPHRFHPPQSNHDNYIIIGDFSFVLV